MSFVALLEALNGMMLSSSKRYGLVGLIWVSGRGCGRYGKAIENKWCDCIGNEGMAVPGSKWGNENSAAQQKTQEYCPIQSIKLAR